MEYDLLAPSQEESGSRRVKQHRSVWKWGVELPFCSNSVGKCRETEVPKMMFRYVFPSFQTSYQWEIFRLQQMEVR